MLFLLSPAKSLDYERPLPADLPHTLPPFIPQSEELIAVLRQLAPQDVAALMSISDKLAQLNVAHRRFCSRVKQAVGYRVPRNSLQAQRRDKGFATFGYRDPHIRPALARSDAAVGRREHPGGAERDHVVAGTARAARVRGGRQHQRRR